MEGSRLGDLADADARRKNAKCTTDTDNARREDGGRCGARSQAGWMGWEVVNGGGGGGVGVCWRSVIALYRRVSFLFRYSEKRETHRAGVAAVAKREGKPEARASETAKNGQLWLVEWGPKGTIVH